MRLPWIGRKAGTLVCGIGDVRSCALLEVVELANDVPVVETVLVMRRSIIMATQ